MIYHCCDCGYKGKKSSSGRCPACGSWKISNKSAVSVEEKVDKYKKLKLWIMVFAWGVFSFELIRMLLD